MKEAVRMAIEKNSLSILIGYLAYLLVQIITQKLFWSSKFLYLILTIIGLLGAGLLLWVNQKFSYTNIIEQPKSKQNFKKILLWGLGGIGLVFIGQILCMLITHLVFKQNMISQNTTQLITIFKNSPIYLLNIVVAAPIIEELIFRKVFFGNLTYYFKPIIAAIFSSILFALAHHDGHFLIYFVMGCILEWIYAKAHDLKAPMIAHGGMNLIILLFFGLR